MNFKKRNQQIHTRKRAIERYGFNLGKNSQHRIVQMILSGKSTFIFRYSNRVTEHEVVYDDQKFRVIFDSLRKSIATVLPPGEQYIHEPD